MLTIDVSALEPVGEFGSQAWCEECARYGVQILESARLPRDLSWGFSEIYTLPPARLVNSERPVSGYHFMVRDGVVSGGDGVPESCLALPGFHARLVWGYICNQSGTKYGREGQKLRGIEERELLQAISDHVGQVVDLGGVPDPVWPKPIAAALSTGSEQGAGLHNIAATLQRPSPEFEGVPVTEMGVPSFLRMSDVQKADFLALCGIASGST